MDRNEPPGHVEGFKVAERVLLVEFAHHIGHFGQEPTRHTGQIHPSQLNVGGDPCQIVDIQIGYAGLEYP